MKITITRNSEVIAKLQPDGKKRRSKAKTILLAVLYGMSAATMAARIGSTKEEAEEIIKNFYAGFKGVALFTQQSQAMLKKYGYVTDLWGRRRHIPDAQLPEFEITPPENLQRDFNPLLGLVPRPNPLAESNKQKYLQQLKVARGKVARDKIIADAKKNGYTIKNNGGFISRALRQCLNARVQGTAASMTKLAMIRVHNDPVMKSLGFKLVCSVHDEMFGEVPRENAEAAAERLAELMIGAAKDKCDCKFKVDPYVISRWYEDELYGQINQDYNKLINGDPDKNKPGLTPEAAYEKMRNKYVYLQEKYLHQMCDGTYECNTHNDI